MSQLQESESGGRRQRNIRLLLEYDGRPYIGWQIQPQGPTVQGVLQKVIGRLTGERITLKGSGRTDAGVHALGQVANFTTGSDMPVETLQRAVNSLSPWSVAVLQAQEVPPDFDARFSALGKTYRYRLLFRPHRSPLEAGRVWHIPYPVKPGRMRLAAKHFIGERDFSSFRASGCSAGDPVRTIRRVTIRQRQDHVDIDLEANGFLRYMVRSIVGTLVDVGRGRLPVSAIPGILRSCDRSRAGRTAPPGGLYLLEVEYPKTYCWPT